MNLLGFFLPSAVHNLRRGGQRVVVALLCIAFGVMSVVSMTLLSESLRRMLVVSPPDLVGGDVTMTREVESVILPEHITGLKTLQKDGQVQQITLIAYTTSLVYRLPGSGELHFPASGMGIDPGTYPLRGAFQILSPGKENPRPTEVIKQAGDILVTRDIVDEDRLKIGGTLLLSDLASGLVVEGHIRGIVTDTPNHQGSKIYYSLETARRLAGSDQVENTALLTSSQPEALLPGLEKQGWRAWPAAALARSNEQVEQMFELGLRGAGILGMLVGGIGIANTMQVLLSRRRKEVAVYKTLGYRQGQLQGMFALEALLLGVVGSVCGAALGVALSYGLVSLFSGVTNLLISWVFSPLPVLTGLLAGVVTTVSFAMFAIVVTSRVPPLALLRNETLEVKRIPWLHSLAVVSLCGLPFVAITGLVVGSLMKGVGVLLFAVLGLAVLGGFLYALIWLATRAVPLRGWPLARMAKNNLKRRGFGSVFAMIALFVGVVSLALSVVVTTSASRAVDERSIRFDGDNLIIIAPYDHAEAIQAAVESQQGIEHVAAGIRTPVVSIRAAGEPLRATATELAGFEQPVGIRIYGAAWGSAPDGVYAPSMANIEVGSQVEVTLFDGVTHLLPVVGSYTIPPEGISPQPVLGLVATTALSQRLARPAVAQFFLRARPDRLKAVSAALGLALPQATVINLPSFAARFTQTYTNLFVFAVAMASLALLAGVLLLANSISLAMLDRRYEIGVLKAVGYARRQVLFTLMVEYSLAALIACASGLLIVQIILWIIGWANKLAGSLLVMSPAVAALIALLGLGLTLLTVLSVTWRPMQVSPLVILNDRE